MTDDSTTPTSATAAATAAAIDMTCHICHEPRDRPGRLFCSASHIDPATGERYGRGAGDTRTDDLLARLDSQVHTCDDRDCALRLAGEAADEVRRMRDERDAARDELAEKWELYRACTGAEVYDVIDPKIRKLYMQLNAQARGDETDIDGDLIQQWNNLVDLATTAVVRWVAANRWAVNEHQRCEKVDAENDRLRADRDALQAMVDCCRELVEQYAVSVKTAPIQSAIGLHDELAAIVGWPPGRTKPETE